ncbi:hypothetical protein [Streptomyces sp. NPDC003717]|uniref:hypothetical protein n=1 Tax=Streptomyces sp. NPDC003717 TaxID=3154276 RepID=UPI0033B302C3
MFRRFRVASVAVLSVLALGAVAASEQSDIDWPGGPMSTTAMAARAGGDVTPQTPSTGDIDWP